MSIKVTYNGDDIIDESASCMKVLKTNNTIMQDDVTVEYDAPPTPVLIEKQIAANGEYDAEDDNADGYSSVTVNVPDTAGQLVAGTITSLTIPEGVTKIRRNLCRGCTALTSISFPSTLTEIEQDGFNGCSSLPSVSLPNGFTTLGTSAFQRCLALTSISFPNTLTTMQNNCCLDCDSLETVVIPTSVVTLGAAAFNSCNNLKYINIPPITQILAQTFQHCTLMVEFDCTDLTVSNGNVDTALNNVNAFANTGTSTFLFATQEIMQVYAQATNWSTYASRMTYVGA